MFKTTLKLKNGMMKSKNGIILSNKARTLYNRLHQINVLISKGIYKHSARYRGRIYGHSAVSRNVLLHNSVLSV